MNKVYIMIISLALLVVGLGIFTACNTFRPIWIDELPAVCNMTLNTYRLHYGSKDKSGAVPSSIACTKKLHRLDCREQIYGQDEKGIKKVDHDDFVLFKEYTACLSELN